MFDDESMRGFITRVSNENILSDPKVLYRVSGMMIYNKFKNMLIPEDDLDLINLSVECYDKNAVEKPPQVK
ncbi:hypothetical protein GCM10010916_36560 [Paenibacillus abyssi]|uniref:Uncharacterized protein n=1 Tax=Paenibacillus abyssi TaxID=1340531 RepID=A0A917G0C0_9BACL|nr:hypothetical protein GCM10010916_36560 [Paenibacillus abyssi]